MDEDFDVSKLTIEQALQFLKDEKTSSQLITDQYYKLISVVKTLKVLLSPKSLTYDDFKASFYWNVTLDDGFIYVYETNNPWTDQSFQEFKQIIDLIANDRTIIGVIFNPRQMYSGQLGILTDMLKHHPSIRTFDIKLFSLRYPFNSADFPVLMDLFNNKNNIQTFKFSDSKLNTDNLILLTDMLSTNDTLISLELLVAGINDNQIKILSKGLEKNHSLRSLVLKGYTITDIGIQYFIDMLDHNTFITDIDIGTTTFFNKELLDILNKKLHDNRFSRSLLVDLLNIL